MPCLRTLNLLILIELYNDDNEARYGHDIRAQRKPTAETFERDTASMSSHNFRSLLAIL